MGLANEAGYLYVYSKELAAVNKRIQRLSNRAEKHARKHSNASDENEKRKHRIKHSRIKSEIERLLKKHHKILQRIKHHHTAFYHSLGKEHRI